GTLNLTCDVRAPLLEPLEGPFRNTHAPSAVRTEDGWLIYYGALDGVESGLALLQRLEYHVSERELIGLRARGPSSCR
ncbi:MAG TPA: hypothetical protein DEP45_09130, partial [Armatimonadetes bacterium]|nr:hypothetical protein [Armatimonadota bacterium]